MSTLILTAAFVLGFGQLAMGLFLTALAIKHAIHMQPSRCDTRRRLTEVK